MTHLPSYFAVVEKCIYYNISQQIFEDRTLEHHCATFIVILHATHIFFQKLNSVFDDFLRQQWLFR